MKISFCLCFIFFAASTHAQQQHFSWLKGTWKVPGKNVFEIWSPGKQNGTLNGRAFVVKGRDTVITEIISLEYYDGSFHYIPDVAGDQRPVDFTVTAFDSLSFVAENPRHDFPKIIRYRHIPDSDKIHASIEGNGEVILYTFERLK